MKLFGNKNNTKNESQTKKRTKKKRSTRHNSLLYLIGILLVSAVLVTTGILLGNDLFALAKEDREITVTIPEDATVGQVSKLLDKSGVVNYGSFFRLFTTIIYRDVTFRPGMWTLNSNMDYRHIVNEIRLTNRSTQTVTIPEGYTIEQIIDTLVENGLSSKDELTSVLQDGEFNYDFLPDDLGNETNRLEGYLFPDTYEFYLSDDAATVWKKVKKMSNGEPRMSQDEPGHLEGNAVFTYMEAFSTNEDFAEFWPEFKNLDELKEQYVKGGIGDGTCKKFLNSVLNKRLDPIRVRRHEFEQDIPEVFNILKRGTEKARETAAQTLDEVRNAMRINYFDDAALIAEQAKKYEK